MKAQAGHENIRNRIISTPTGFLGNLRSHGFWKSRARMKGRHCADPDEFLAPRYGQGSAPLVDKDAAPESACAKSPAGRDCAKRRREACSGSVFRSSRPLVWLRRVAHHEAPVAAADPLGKKDHDRARVELSGDRPRRTTAGPDRVAEGCEPPDGPGLQIRRPVRPEESCRWCGDDCRCRFGGKSLLSPPFVCAESSGPGADIR